METYRNQLLKRTMQRGQMHSCQPTIQQQIKLAGFKKQWHILQSPQIVDRICQLRQHRYQSPAHSQHQNSIQGLLRAKSGTNIKRINENRQKFRAIKNKLINTMSTINADKANLTLSQILVWKQEILTGFLNEFMQEIGRECKEKAQILSYIWNTIFNLVQYIFETLGKVSKEEEQNYLSTLLQNHKSYQTVIQNYKNRLGRKEEDRQEQEAFIETLVQTLRYKRKEVKKLTKNIKTFTAKLNQFKDCYLDLQSQHIQLLSQNRDISKQNALNLLQRKQQINLQRRKEYKLKQSQKKVKFQIENQIKYQNQHEQQNVQKLNEELRSAFKKRYRENKDNKDTPLQAHSVFEDALDDFNVRVDNMSQTQTLIDFKNNVAFMDAATDMQDFQRDQETAQTQITYNDRLFEDLITNTAVQTVQIKPKLKIYDDTGIQVSDAQIKWLKFTRVKVIDRSYLVNDYRDKRYKTQKSLGAKFVANPSVLSAIDSNKQLQSHRSGGGKAKSSAQVQTNQVFIIDFAGVNKSYRDLLFQKQIKNYIQQLSLNKKSPQYAQKKQFLKRKWFGQNRNAESSISQRSIHSSQRDTQRRSLNSSSAHHFGENNNQTARQNQISSRSFSILNGSRKQSRETLRKTKVSFEPISQHKYEQLTSNQVKVNQQVRMNEQRQKILQMTKYWILKPTECQVISLPKRRLVNSLNQTDKLIYKSNAGRRGQAFVQDKRILMQLQRLSEQFNNKKATIQQLSSNISQNMSILKQQLRKMLSKKTKTRKLALSRQHSLFKIISFVYTYAYHLFFNQKQPLENMIIPLFHYFKIGYGQIKKNDLYLRMLYFLSQTICHKAESTIFESFITMLGLNFSNNNQQPQAIVITKDTTGLYLRLLHALSVNFRFPLNVEHLYTVVGIVQQKTRKVLNEEGFGAKVIDHVIERVRTKLGQFGQQHQAGQQQNSQFCELKLNVFKCCQLILQQLQKSRKTVLDSYKDLNGYFQQAKLSQQAFYLYVLNNSYMKKEQYRQKFKSISVQLQKRNSRQRLNSIVQVFFKLSIADFNKLYYSALAKYKIKEQFLMLSLQRRLPFLFVYIDKHQPQFACQQTLIKLIKREQDNPIKQALNKRILALAYLRVIEQEGYRLLQDVVGESLANLLQLQL